MRLPGTSISDNEIKTRVISAINTYFNIENWDFGDTFYFTELSSYIHPNVGNTIGGSIVIVQTVKVYLEIYPLCSRRTVQVNPNSFRC